MLNRMYLRPTSASAVRSVNRSAVRYVCRVGCRCGRLGLCL